MNNVVKHRRRIQTGRGRGTSSCKLTSCLMLLIDIVSEALEQTPVYIHLCKIRSLRTLACLMQLTEFFSLQKIFCSLFNIFSLLQFLAVFQRFPSLLRMDPIQLFHFCLGPLLFFSACLVTHFLNCLSSPVIKITKLLYVYR